MEPLGSSKASEGTPGEAPSLHPRIVGRVLFSRTSKIELSSTRELDFHNFYCLEKFSLLMALGSKKDTQILHLASFW